METDSHTAVSIWWGPGLDESVPEVKQEPVDS